MRSLIELRPNEAPIGEMVIAGGQSGLPSHKHYTDQIDSWYKVEYFPIEWVKSESEKKWAFQYNFK